MHGAARRHRRSGKRKAHRSARLTSLVFLHGVGGGHHAWDAQLPFFAAHGFGAHAWDQPGYGESQTVQPYDLEQVSAALARLIAHLDDGPVVLVGHSMGGFIAQETYLRHPELVKALALTFTSAAFGGGTAFAQDFMKARIGPLDEGRTMAQMAASLVPTMRTTRSDPRGLAHAERIMAGVPPDTYRKAVHLLTTFDRRADLPRIRVPTFVLAGGEDNVAPASTMQKMAAKIPGAEFRVLEGAGHLGPMDQPAEFNAALLAFLERDRL